MKKTTKKMFAVLSAMAIMATGAISTNVSALDISANPDYVEYIKTLEISEEEDWLMEIDYTITEYFMSDYTPIHVYESDRSLFFEYGKDNIRSFKKGLLLGMSMEVPDENVSITSEELNEFLQTEGIDATVSALKLTDLNGSYVLGGNINTSSDMSNKIKAYRALCTEYGFEPSLVFEANGSVSFEFTDDEEQTATEPTTAVTFGTPTIAGDIDMNGSASMADIAKLAKYVSNAELFPITDPTALANADITQDGVIDQLDTNMLIEIALGMYESAV